MFSCCVCTKKSFFPVLYDLYIRSCEQLSHHLSRVSLCSMTLCSYRKLLGKIPADLGQLSKIKSLKYHNKKLECSAMRFQRFKFFPKGLLSCYLDSATVRNSLRRTKLFYPIFKENM